MMASIGVLGEVMLGRGVGQRLNDNAALAVWEEALLALTAALDLVIANLECCLAIGGRPTRRTARKPFFLRGPQPTPAQRGTLSGTRLRGAPLAQSEGDQLDKRQCGWRPATALSSTGGHPPRSSRRAAGSPRGPGAYA